MLYDCLVITRYNDFLDSLSKKTLPMKKYILNNYYILRHDLKRSYIMAPGDPAFIKPIPINTGWVSKIHPIYAMIFSFFSEPISLKDAIREIAVFFDIEEDYILSFLKGLINSKEPTHTTLEGIYSGFPVNLLIEETKQFTPKVLYKIEDFLYSDLDFKTVRMLLAPMTIVFMPNNNCLTDCVYCYADTKTKPQKLSFNVIEKFISEAKKLKIRDLLITGGDFFMYKQWEKLLKTLIKEGYKPDLISTKVPINQETIGRFSKYNIRLQISLDSVSEHSCSKILNVGSKYLSKIKEMLINIDKSSIRYQVATVITNLNDSIQEIDKLAEFIKQLDNVERWEIRIAFKSLYSKSSFDSVKSNRKQIIEIEKWIDKNKEKCNTEILWSPDEDEKYRTAKGGSENFEGAKCSANMTNMVILPDGKVTICEQLYWNSNFIIGDIKDNTITEIWSSPKAIGLWKRKQISIKKDSPCSKCIDFKECFSAANRCYANIMKAYGDDNYDYPDPRCYLAPKFTNTITHE